MVTLAYRSHKEEEVYPRITAVQKVTRPAVHLIAPPNQPFHGQDLRGLDFFMMKMAKPLDLRCPQLWETIAPQLASSTPALRHGIVALAGFYEQKLYGTSPKAYSLDSYNVAIRMLLNTEKQQIALTDQLLSCLLFIVIEFLQGNIPMAVELIKAGRRIVYTSRRSRKTATQEAFLQPIEDTFRRLDAHVLEVCHHALEPDLPFSKCWNLESEHKLPDVVNFTNEAQALRCLGLLMNTWQVARRTGSPLDHASFHDALVQWRRKLQSLEGVTSKAKASHEMWWHECEVMILLQADLEKAGRIMRYNEQGWDKYEAQFSTIVSLAEELTFNTDTARPVFSICPNVTSVMFRTVIRCRSPQIRRRAIRVIEVANSQEGLLKPEWVLQITKKIVALEEDGLLIEHAKNIEQECRVQDFSIDWDTAVPSKLKAKYYIGDKVIVEDLGRKIEE